MRILLVMLEFPLWLKARQWSYPGNYAIEEGMKAHGIETVVLPAFHGIGSQEKRSWLSYAKCLFEHQTFDQVWLWTVHNDYDPEFLEFIMGLAPVRIGWLGENLFYTPEEHSLSLELRERKETFMRQVKALTHVLVAADEIEVEYIERLCHLPAIWWPTAVPLDYVTKNIEPVSINQAVFCGFPYGPRKQFLQNDAVSRTLISIAPPENAYTLPDQFNALCVTCMNTLEKGVGVDMDTLDDFNRQLKQIRQSIFSVWQKGLSRFSLNVNLPSYGKCYTSRVVETMGAGRPVLAWKVPDRPRNDKLFKDGEEIFLYDGDDPDHFAMMVRQLLKDESLLMHVAKNARHKVLKYHTTEIRIRQVMDWISTGVKPAYSDSEVRDQNPTEKERDFYIDLFTKNKEWASSEPNEDELARWQTIEQFLTASTDNRPHRPDVLDVGCGRGWLADRVSTFGNYLGIEPVSEVVAHAQDLYPTRNFQAGCLSDLGKDQLFDIIIASEVLEHVPLNIQAEFIRQLYDHTRQDGFVIITTPRAELYPSWSKIVEPQTTEYWLNESGLERMFTVSGFHILKKQRIYKTMPKVFAIDPVKQDFVAPDQVPLYQGWLFTKPE